MQGVLNHKPSCLLKGGLAFLLEGGGRGHLILGEKCRGIFMSEIIDYAGNVNGGMPPTIVVGKP